MLDEETIRSSQSEIEEFKDSFVWLDIKEELNDLAKRAELEYDLVGEPHVDDSGHMIVPNTSETLIHLGDIKGRRKAISYFLSIPDILLQILEDKKDDNRLNETS